MWCPACRGEWRPEVAVCPDCDKSLVEEFPPLPDPPARTGGAAETESVGSHEIVELGATHLDEVARWQVSLFLDAQHIAHRWEADHLVVPEQHVEAARRRFPVIDADKSESGGPITDRTSVRDEIPVRGRTRGLLGARVLAWAIDAIVVLLLTVPVLVLWTARTTRPSLLTGEPVLWQEPTAGANVVAIGLVVAYYVLGVGLFGRTLGKQLLGLRVRRLDGTIPGLQRATLRFIVPTAGWWLAAALPLNGTVGYFTTLLLHFVWPAAVATSVVASRDRRGLHDLAAGTIVVNPRS